MFSIDGFVSELDNEAKATRRLLERVPEDQLGWKPHDKSMTLGQLAIHIASIPGRVGNVVLGEGLDAQKANFHPPQPETKKEILETFEAGVVEGKRSLNELTEESAMASWKLTAGDREVFSIPRIGVVRNIMLNHWYHHRGQLTVYLRLLNVPLPITYGRSADESPF